MEPPFIEVVDQTDLKPWIKRADTIVGQIVDEFTCDPVEPINYLVLAWTPDDENLVINFSGVSNDDIIDRLTDFAEGLKEKTFYMEEEDY